MKIVSKFALYGKCCERCAEPAMYGAVGGHDGMTTRRVYGCEQHWAAVYHWTQYWDRRKVYEYGN